jgi:pyroglutamyl-peptidase
VAEVLVIGYEEIGVYSPNPAGEVAARLDGEAFGSATATARVLKCDSTKAPIQVRAAIDEVQPNLVVGLGVFPGCLGLQVERVAVNCLDFQIPDEGGNQWMGVPVVDGGPPAYFATVPVKAMVTAMRAAGVPTRLSNSASTHMCNQTLFTELHHISDSGLDARAGFIHLPNLPEFSAKMNEWGPTMSLETMLVGVRAGISAAVTTETDEERNVEPWEW